MILLIFTVLQDFFSWRRMRTITIPLLVFSPPFLFFFFLSLSLSFSHYFLLFPPNIHNIVIIIMIINSQNYFQMLPYYICITILCSRYSCSLFLKEISKRIITFLYSFSSDSFINKMFGHLKLNCLSFKCHFNCHFKCHLNKANNHQDKY